MSLLLNQQAQKLRKLKGQVKGIQEDLDGRLESAREFASKTSGWEETPLPTVEPQEKYDIEAGFTLLDEKVTDLNRLQGKPDA